MLLSEILEVNLLSIEELRILEAVKMMWCRKKDKIIRSGVKEQPLRGHLESMPPFKRRFEVKKD